MSLLIDALRKAEKDREQSTSGRDDLEGLALEPMGPAIPEPPQTLPPEAFAQREAAANLFEVKQDDAPQGRLVWFAVAGVIAGLCIGAWVWWQMQPVGSMLQPPASLSSDAARAPAAPPATIATAPQPAAAPSPAPAVSSEIAAPAPVARAELAPERAVNTQRGDLGKTDVPVVAPPVKAAEPPVRLARARAPQPQIPATLSSAYEAYNAGDLTRARSLYADYLRADPNNTDALNGLGAIAMQQGRTYEAIRWFRAALAAQPADPVAIAGLASLSPAADPIGEESRFREQSEAGTQSPTARFALGNALAQQGRWSEAQSAYFDAHVNDPGNPDYLFNLAVSLDRMTQPALAIDYYRQALEAAAARPAAFDPAAVRTRLSELTGAGG